MVLVGFYDKLSNKLFSIHYDVTAIYLPNRKIIALLDYTPLLHGSTNCIICTSQAHYFGMCVHDSANRHDVKQYMHDGKWSIPIIQQPIQ